MGSSTILLTCALTAGAFAAAPVPLPAPWVRGWDKPIDPAGDCQITRDGGKLTIIVPGAGHEFDVQHRKLNAPRLLRSVQGDFIAQVRLRGTFKPTGNTGHHRAGFVLSNGETMVRLQRAANCAPATKAYQEYIGCHMLGRQGGMDALNLNPPVPTPVHLRIERRAGKVSVSCSQDGKKWHVHPGMGFTLPGELKLGVLAEATAAGEFKVEFDEFKFTPLPAQPRPRTP